MDKKKTRVFIERGNDGTYGAYIPDDHELPFGVIGDGNSASEAIEDFLAVYEEMKTDALAEGKVFTEPEFSFSYDVPSFLQYYCKLISIKGLAKLSGVSAAQLSQYANGYRHPSPKTTAKIQKGLQALVDDISQVSLV